MTWTLHLKNIGRSKGSLNGNTPENHHLLSTYFSSRYSKDKAHFESDQYIVVLDGIVLNSTQMLEAYQTKTMADALISAYKDNGELFMNELRGSFNGCLYDKQQHLWLLFVNHYGDRPLFYHMDGQDLFVSSDFNLVADFVKRSGGDYAPDLNAAYYILTYGFMIDDSTHIKGIRRLMPGDYICIQDGDISIKPYFRFSNKNTLTVSFEEAIDLVDIEFNKAVQRTFDKDLEYGYQTHLADMSGGLDSRMVTWVARELGYDNITNICYAQSESPEWKAAMNVAKALGNDFIFMPLDKCNFLYDVDKIIDMNYGLAFYAGITGGQRFLERMNFNLFGLEMTGQLGDVIIGTYVSGKPLHTPANFHKHRYSNFLTCKFNERLTESYDNDEMFALYNRGFLGMLSTHITRNNYTDVVSPFCDVEFLSFCLSLPLAYRFDHKLYNAWVLQKHPNAAKIPTTRYDGPVRKRLLLSRSKEVIKKGPGYLVRRLLGLCGVQSKGSPKNMNPFQYWYMTDDKARNFIHNYYHENIQNVAAGTKLHEDMNSMFNKGRVTDKLLVLTVLAAYKQYGLKIHKTSPSISTIGVQN